MKLLIFSDIHGDKAALERLMSIEADHYFAAGDLVSWARGFERVGPILAQRAGRVHVLPGNHESEDDITRFCQEYNLHAFHCETMELDGYQIAGIGYSSPTPFNTPGEYSEREFAIRLKKFGRLQRLILVCHCPPRDTPLDLTGAGQHIGSSAIREFVDNYQPLWLFAGHVHETEGAEIRIGATRAVNAGKRGYLLDLDQAEAGG